MCFGSPSFLKKQVFSNQKNQIFTTLAIQRRRELRFYMVHLCVIAPVRKTAPFDEISCQLPAVENTPRIDQPEN